MAQRKHHHTIGVRLGHRRVHLDKTVNELHDGEDRIGAASMLERVGKRHYALEHARQDGREDGAAQQFGTLLRERCRIGRYGAARVEIGRDELSANVGEKRVQRAHGEYTQRRRHVATECRFDAANEGDEVFLRRDEIAQLCRNP